MVSVSIKIWKNTVRKNNRRKLIAPSMNIDDYELIDIKGTSLNTEQGILKKETER